ncbi:hypothetical protein ES703_03730 [subsurface metagenome]
MITIASTEALDNFPDNLPSNIQEPFKENMTKTLTKIRDQLKKGGAPKFRIHSKMVQFSFSGERKELSKHDMTLIKINHFFVAAFMLGIYKSKLLEKKIPADSFVRINFDDALYSQELVMIFAYLDAFMDDTLRIIYECCPERLKCERKITWETVIDLKSYKRLIDYIISKFVRKEFRNLPIKDRIEFLEERADLEMDIPENVLKGFAIAEQVRHIIIHNAGRIDSEFLIKTKLKESKIGEYHFSRGINQISGYSRNFP